jgi:hypothetical protein
MVYIHIKEMHSVHPQIEIKLITFIYFMVKINKYQINIHYNKCHYSSKKVIHMNRLSFI